MGSMIRATATGALVGIGDFIGVVAANALLAMVDLAVLRNGGGGFNLIWLGLLPCFIAAAVAARIMRARPVRFVLAALAGAGGGLLATSIAFHFLAGMQGLNPLIFAGPFCAAVIATVISRIGPNEQQAK